MSLAIYAYAIVGVVVIATALVALAFYLDRARPPSQDHTGADQIVACPVCLYELPLSVRMLEPLSSVEIGLAVRALPGLQGERLARHTCSHCESELCFILRGRQFKLAGTNLYTPHDRAGRCQNCGKPFAEPSWAPAQYDGRILQAPGLTPDIGLICGRCHARVCYGCVQNATRNRTKDGSLICPRCFRTPVDKSFHPRTM